MLRNGFREPVVKVVHALLNGVNRPEAIRRLVELGLPR
jgi:hypothetical protein